MGWLDFMTIMDMNKNFIMCWKEKKKLVKQEKLRKRLLKKQQALMERLIRENNEKIMNERGYYGLYDKKGNLK